MRHHGLGVFLDSVAEFYAMAVVVGLVQGGVQSLSRSFFGRFVPAGKSAEYFGFYNMMGKFAHRARPAADRRHRRRDRQFAQRASPRSPLLFLAGGALLWRVQAQPRRIERVDARQRLVQLAVLRRELARAFEEGLGGDREEFRRILRAVGIDQRRLARHPPRRTARRIRARSSPCQVCAGAQARDSVPSSA